MIQRCLSCGTPIFHGFCTCGKRLVRCPDCDGSGKQKTMELMSDDGGYMGYMLLPHKEDCQTCGGVGRVTITYNKVES